MAQFRDSSTTRDLMPIVDVEDGFTIWWNATWIGEVDETELSTEGRLPLHGGEQFARARVLVWSAGVPRGFVELPVTNGAIDVAQLSEQIAALPASEARKNEWPLPPITVALCTRDRPDQLRDVLATLLQLDYPQFEVLVVDNNPSSGLTPPVVEEMSSDTDVSVELALAPQQGLSIARNVALEEAHFDIVAFTDDDVVVESSWLRNLAYGFARAEDVACVCGIVPSAEIVTPAQCYFDRRVGWARQCEPAVFDLSDPPDGDPLFPMRVSQFGTGANFAVQRGSAIALGGFDEGMGVGSPTGGGEDIDLFVRTLLAGHLVVREPSAVVWHRHRRTAEELEVQVRNYGLGLGAWITKLMTRPKTIYMVLRRVRPAVRHLRSVTVVDQQDTVDGDPELVGLDQRELRAVFKGPFALMRARYVGRRAYPLISDPDEDMYSPVRDLSSQRGERFAERFGLSPKGFASGAVALGLIGSIGAVQSLPPALLAVAVAVFMFLGPGALVMSWYTHLPRHTVASLVFVVSLAVSILGVAGPLLAGYYAPKVILLSLTGATAVVGAFRFCYLAMRSRSVPAT